MYTHLPLVLTHVLRTISGVCVFWWGGSEGGNSVILNY